MPKFSAFTPFGMLKFSGGPSRAELIYRSMYATKVEAFDLTEGSYAEGKIYSQALGLARASNALERAKNQLNPYKCIDLLPELEKDWSVVPGENDTIYDRQLAVAVKMALSRGATRESIENGLENILGSHFLSLRTLVSIEAVRSEPTSNFIRPDLPSKLVRLSEPVATLNTPYAVAYENADTTAGKVSLRKGDVITIDPENIGQTEVLTIASATDETFTATFTKSHDVGCFVTTQNWPRWRSTQRTYFIVVDAESAINPDRVRRVNDFMGHIGRGVSFWHIIQPTVPGGTVAGPFTLDVSPLGTTPIAAFEIYNAQAGTGLFNIESIDPPTGSYLGGSVHTIRGTGIDQLTSATVAGVTSIAITPIDATAATIALPAHAVGPTYLSFVPNTSPPDAQNLSFAFTV